MAGSGAIAQFSVFGAYDLAISRWCRKVVSGVEGASDMAIVMASPMRAFGEAKRVLMKNSTPGSSANATIVPKVPLPLISITRGGIERREGRIYPFSGVFRGWLPTTDISRRLRFESRPPMPLSIEYQIDIWSKTINTQAALVDKFIESFDPKTAYGFVTPHKDWGTYRMPVHWGSMTDSSELEGGDDGDRIVRNTLSVVVDAWKFFDVTSELTVLTTNMHEDMGGVSVRWLKDRKYKSIYIQTKEGLWYRIFINNSGLINLIPSEPPTENVTLYNEQLIASVGGLTLQEKPGLYYKMYWSTSDSMICLVHDPVNDDGVEEHLVIQSTQNLLIGQDRGTQYGELRISGMGAPMTKERLLIDPSPIKDGLTSS